MIRRILICTSTALLTGCFLTPGPGSSPDTGGDALDGVDAGTAEDALGGDVAGEDAEDAGDDAFQPECRDSEPVDLGERTAVETGDWVTAETNPNDNPIRPAIRRGRFNVPSNGETAHGVEWTAESPEETGVFTTDKPSDAPIGYAATTIEVDEPTVLVAEMHGLFELFAGGIPYSGDIYGDDYLVPVPLEPGANQIVFRFTGRTKPRITLTQAAGEMAVDPGDASYPHLRVGTDTQLPLGIPALNLAEETLTDVTAEVVENENFEATERVFPAVGPDVRTQLGFRLKPKSEWQEAGREVTARLRVSACELEEAYEFDYKLQTKPVDETFRRTFVSPVDGSVQYYGARPPKDYSKSETYGLVMSLHGAGVDGGGLPSSYSDKEWAWIISPTNRRPFGFNWEEWGHFNALASMEHAESQWPIDPSRVHITGHSMGGHGTWHVGVHNPGEFATVVPSAGWESIYSYPPGRASDRPSGTRARSRAHSDTKEYLSNIQNRSVYVIHGKADENVPFEEGEKMCGKAKDVIDDPDDVKCHFEEGAEHWWDGDEAEGTDCVDWPAAWEMMKNREVDPTELEFEYETPGPWYGPTHSYVKIDSSETPMEDVTLTSTKTGESELELTTSNVRAMEIDGEALGDKGIETIVVDDESHDVPDGTLRIGPEDGKNAEQHGPYNQVFRDPFCFVFPKDGSAQYRELATYLSSSWSVRGNGYSCAMPVSYLDDQTRDEWNIVYIGVDPERANLPEDRPFSWDGTNLSIGDKEFVTLAAATAFPEGDGMAAAIFARPDTEDLLLHPMFMPFDSRRGMPDYYLVAADGSGGAELNYGFYDANWEADAELRD